MHKTESEKDNVKFITAHVQHYRKFISFLRELLQCVGILGFLLLNFLSTSSLLAFLAASSLLAFLALIALGDRAQF
jgi:hypothetical protein